MNTPSDSSLGREVRYPDHYDAGLLFPIPRAGARGQIGIDEAALPFAGHDRWHAYELSWLSLGGLPQVTVATFCVPCSSPNLIESKSFKLYLNSLNAARFTDPDAVREVLVRDLSACAGAPVTVSFDLPPATDTCAAVSIDGQDLQIDSYGPPQAGFLRADAGDVVEEVLTSALLKSNCPVTGQPDWASVDIAYRGPAIDRAGLLRYLVSFRDHAEFHEQCVERLFADITARCAPQRLAVQARYTRRGGLDINPVRVSPGTPLPAASRDQRQ